MRALCGSIIAAGALIGMGLAAIGLGSRYQSLPVGTPENINYLRWRYLDTPMEVVLVVLLVSLAIGLAMAFIGLAYHHERRQYERTHRAGEARGTGDAV